MGAEDVVGSDTSSTEPAIHGLHLYGFAARLLLSRKSVTNATGHQLFKMYGQSVPQLAGRTEPIFWLVLDSSHQDLFHLARESGSDLSRSRVLAEIENQQRIVLWIRSRQQVEHRGAQAINV